MPTPDPAVIARVELWACFPGTPAVLVSTACPHLWRRHFLPLARVCVHSRMLFSARMWCASIPERRLSLSLSPSVPLIPERVTNGRSRCCALLCPPPRERSSVCVCTYSLSWGGLGSLRRGLSKMLLSRREGRVSARWGGGTHLSQLALRPPQGTRLPSATPTPPTPQDVRLCRHFPHLDLPPGSRCFVFKEDMVPRV